MVRRQSIRRRTNQGSERVSRDEGLQDFRSLLTKWLRDIHPVSMPEVCAAADPEVAYPVMRNWPLSTFGSCGTQPVSLFFSSRRNLKRRRTGCSGLGMKRMIECDFSRNRSLENHGESNRNNNSGYWM
jgi:hypothetical protein